jgi:transcription elongation factor GreB
MGLNKNNYITRVGHEKLVSELNELLKNERPEITKLIQWAASNGDRSENADYLYGKRRLREIDKRIRFLMQRLDLAIVVDPASAPQKNIVQFGATVNVCDENGISKTWTIVGTDEVDTSKYCISWKSPMGQALLGKGIGDEILVKAPSGELIYEIVSIQYPKQE